MFCKIFYSNLKVKYYTVHTYHTSKYSCHSNTCKYFLYKTSEGNCLCWCSIDVKRTHDCGHSYKGKHLVEA